MSETLLILLGWFVCFLLVRFTIRVKDEATKGPDIDEMLSFFMQLFAPATIILYPIIVGFLAFDKKVYAAFKQLILKLTK